MGLYPERRVAERSGARWSEQIAWTAASLGVVALLLLTLVIWVETLGLDDPAVPAERASPPRRGVPVHLAPLGAEIPMCHRPSTHAPFVAGVAGIATPADDRA